MSRPGDSGPPAHIAWTDAAGTYQALTFDVVTDEQWSAPSTITKHPVEVGAAVTDNIRVEMRTCTLKVIASNEPIGAERLVERVAEERPLALTNQQAIQVASALGANTITVTPGDGIIDAPDWDSGLQARILASSAAGFVGNAIGGTAGGVVGGLAAGALGSALSPGKVGDRMLQTDARGLSAAAPGTITPTVIAFDEPDDFVLLTISLLEALRAQSQTFDVYGTKSSCIGPGGPDGLGGMGLSNLVQERNASLGTGAQLTLTFEEVRVVYTTTVPAPKPTAADSTKKVSKGNQSTTELSDAAAKIAAAALSGYQQGKKDFGPDDDDNEDANP